MASLTDLRNSAEQIATETVKKANTASRVGSLVLEVINFFWNQLTLVRYKAVAIEQSEVTDLEDDLDDKANVADVYDKVEIDAAFDTVNDAIALKADESTVEALDVELTNVQEDLEAMTLVGVGTNYLVFVQKINGVQQIIATSKTAPYLHTYMTATPYDNINVKLSADTVTYERNKVVYYQVLGTWVETKLFPNLEICCWGDSLTKGIGGGVTTYPSLLATLTGLSTDNKGVGGFTSSQIAARQGGVNVQVTLNGNLIPAAGGATLGIVAVTSKNINYLMSGEEYVGYMTGFLCGISGRITTDALGNWSFYRFTSGTATDCPPNSIFTIEPSYSDANQESISVIWAGRNNFRYPENIYSDIDAMISHKKSINKKYIILSVINGDYPSEKIGSTEYHFFEEIRNYLADKYGSHFLDIWQLLVDSYNPAEPQDVIDYSAGIVPYSLRNDSIHLNAAGYTIVANAIYAKLLQLKYI